MNAFYKNGKVFFAKCGNFQAGAAFAYIKEIIFDEVFIRINNTICVKIPFAGRKVVVLKKVI